LPSISILALRAVCVAACLLSFGAARAALFEDDEARRAILDLRQKVDQIQQRNADQLRKLSEDNTQGSEQLNGQLGQLRRSILELSNLIESLRGELAAVRGQGEQLAREQLQLARELAEVQRRQKDIAQGTEERLKKFEPSKVTVDGLEFMAEPAETRDYDAALAVMRKGDFALALPAFTDFVRRYPASGYHPSALFWLGNLHYAQRNYKDAMAQYRALVAVAPAHLRAPEAMLSIANCQVELKETKAARKTLEDLVKAYAQSEAATVAKTRLAKIK
jgi:tol-pal system protein YbgF